MQARCAILPLEHHRVDALGWSAQAQAALERGARLLTLWGKDASATQPGATSLYACWLQAHGLTLVQLDLAPDVMHYPGLHTGFPVAERLQRALRDLLGVQALGMDARPWLRHTAWPAQVHPLRRGAQLPQPPCGQAQAEHYAFVPVDGDGVHEVPVGPVHAGVIEPGQFRFSIVGEKILRLEERLGFTHKGVEKRFEGMTLQDGVRLAARLSGDSAVANAWAYCMACETLAGVQPPPRALALRALLLERERLANHLGDIGAIANDGGFGFALAQFGRLKEDMLRLNLRVFGARYPMDAVQPGGVGLDLDADAVAMLHNQGVLLGVEVLRLKDILDQHEGLQDRFRTTGRVEPDLAARLGMIGLAGRASGQALDLRTLPQFAPYAALGVEPAQAQEGDVGARVAVRFAEVFTALRLCGDVLSSLPEGGVRADWPQSVSAGLALGLVEGWRGPQCIALETDAQGRIARCHPHDPSWQNWPAIEWAVIGDIVPDFPLINKSFNLSYSGHDL
ncbi:MAG: Ni,Fe-hydrogenase III large subunit [Thiomonas sp.]|uniref:hydrogenase large subunit n=1 Tax=Thiomonas sp. TaxID=2047785 RepID=UPI002A36B7D1|nr:Ni,Fe-hydrogenase III large subunit [Thiomonas sp.]MDY0329288.1 Ni,Fe-hydrogenase III large subunit [Thiomonas sp.]